MKKLAGRPGTSTRAASTQPECGISCSSCAGRWWRAVVTYSVRPSLPPKQGMVGQRTGSANSPRSSPEGAKRSSRPPSYSATQ